MCLQSQSCPFPANSLLPICPCPRSCDVTPLRLGLYHRACVSVFMLSSGSSTKKVLAKCWLAEGSQEGNTCLQALPLCGTRRGPRTGWAMLVSERLPSSHRWVPSCVPEALRSLSPLEQGGGWTA